MSFVQDYVKNDCRIEDIDDYIDRWHTGDGKGQELYEFLGMTKIEYSDWVSNPSILGSILDRYWDEFLDKNDNPDPGNFDDFDAYGLEMDGYMEQMEDGQWVRLETHLELLKEYNKVKKEHNKLNDAYQDLIKWYYPEKE